jgi:ribonucleotide monophosphatase NagD (HAD superfamily)
MLTALVLTGVSRRSDLDGQSNQPDFVLENLTEFLDLLE